MSGITKDSYSIKSWYINSLSDIMFDECAWKLRLESLSAGLMFDGICSSTPGRIDLDGNKAEECGWLKTWSALLSN
ncbi:hypothetical protein [Endozoicomonas sp. SCSIO W0465]|uniref:hypothetical protein n=1 Tax=Endozoicomonas sp. SCSIO W0465 TaxID=2918516 RepID=UPI002075AA4A|nr:hypothetical protein [Endozoicomonas sp. SCSIO W0465]USE37891.1 hypothetical protein MJO57_06785 [Endozoicomonas sp. SCSIO W0465]